jgi:uncharacterized protein
MNKRSFIKQLEKHVKNNYRGELHHGWAHLNRVRKYAVYIAEKEGADVFVVEVAALLHDIAKIKYGSTVEFHAAKSARMAKSILRKMGLDAEVINKVYSCINSHSRREPPKPRTLEAKCLYDADGLELVGAVGVMRSALYAAYFHKNWREMLKKVKTRVDANHSFYTNTGKRTARKRITLVKNFYKELELELNWKK